MTVTSELFFVSLVVLLLVLMVLLVLCWILKHSRSRNLTELWISAGRPTRVLTIRTEQDHAQQLMDRLLDRVFLQVEPRPDSGEEHEEEPAEGLGVELGSDPEVSAAASLPSRAVNSLHDKLWKWITIAVPPAATPPPPPPPPPLPPTNQDQNDDLGPQRSDAPPLSSQSSSCSLSWDEEQKHDESQV